jgi:hypothetical protein
MNTRQLTETVKTGELKAGDVIQEINPLTGEVTHSVVEFVKAYTALSGAKMWRVSTCKNDKIGWATGSSQRFHRIIEGE